MRAPAKTQAALFLAFCAASLEVGINTPAEGTQAVEVKEDGSLLQVTASDRALRQEAADPSRGPIPLVVYVTSADPELTGELASVWAENMRRFPSGTQLRHFNNSQMLESVREISDELSRQGVVNGSYEAFTNLRPMAFRSDMWRLMALWQHGGFYFDHKLVVTADIGDWFDLRLLGTLWLVKDIHAAAFFQAIMASPPRHPVLEIILRHVVQNVHERRYPGDVLAVTGPVAVGQAMGIRDVRLEDGIWSYGTWSYGGFSNVPAGREPRVNGVLVNGWGPSCDDFCVRSLEPEPRLLCRTSPSLHRQSGSSYRALYEQHQVYCDEAGPPCP